jgi:ubiquitin carboxyl-terminal hydrolase 9/24
VFDAVSAIIKSLKSLASCVSSQEENIRQLEMFRLKMILRQLQISSFGGKMNALNEVKGVITSVSYYPQQSGPNSQGQVIGGNNQQNRQTQGGNANLAQEEEDFLTADRMAIWLKDNKVLQIVLQDSLHQPQYVEKLEKVIRFIIKEKSLTLEDLHDIWNAQVGQHEAIVKNVHDLLAKLAWDFSPEQLDHLFECFQHNWIFAGIKERSKLMELSKSLATQEQENVMAERVMELCWELSHAIDASKEVIDQALSAIIAILQRR